MAFYIGESASYLSEDLLIFIVGFLIWEFPTTYLAQKTRVAKYLGKIVPLICVLLSECKIRQVQTLCYGASY